MIIYNVTVKIESEIQTEWEQWMQTVHIPEVMATGLFKDAQLRKLLYLEDDGVSYSVQYRCGSMADLETYQSQHANRLQAEHANRYKDRYVAFRTLMHQLEEF